MPRSFLLRTLKETACILTNFGRQYLFADFTEYSDSPNYSDGLIGAVAAVRTSSEGS